MRLRRLVTVLAAALPAAVADAQAPPDSARPAADDTRVECARGASGASAAGAPDSPSDEANATGVVCRTDAATYVGWRVYVERCAVCHADDAEGSEFAPSLVHRLRGFDRRAFYRALDQGYAGGNAGLGPWGNDPDVARYYDELWAYLSGRAAGTVPDAELEPFRRATPPPR